jgi:DNA repair protein RecO (recombination protein O)
MPIESATGVIIRLSDYSETSQIATFLTDRFGKVSAIAKGAKRAKSSTGGAMDMLTVNEITFSTPTGATLATLREARVIEQFTAPRMSPEHYYAALYFAELADIFAEGIDKPKELFDLLIETLRALSAADREAAGNLLAYFETHVLRVSGLAPNLAECASCGGTLDPGPETRISLSDGGILCKDCPGGIRVSPATVAAIRRVLDSTVQSVQRLKLHKEQATEMADVLAAMVVFAAHRRPRLLSYVRPGFERAARRWSEAGRV